MKLVTLWKLIPTLLLVLIVLPVITTNPAVIIDGDGSGGEIMASANPGQPTEPEITGTGYYPLYADNILGSGFFAASGQTTGQPDCFYLALEVEASGGRVTSLDLVSGGEFGLDL